MFPHRPGFSMCGICVTLVTLVVLSGCGDRTTPTGTEVAATLEAVPEHVQPLRTWAARLSGPAADYARAAAADPEGGVAVVGTFFGPARFGRFELGATEGRDVFVVKYGPSGQVTWAQSAAGPDYESVTGVALDRQGNVFVIGGFRSSVQFGGHTLTSNGGDDIFLVKLDPRGVVRWARNLGGPEDEAARDIAVDAGGNIIIGGYSQGGSRIGPFELPRRHAGFVARCRPNGTVEWVTSLIEHPSTDDAFLAEVDVDNEGNVYVAGNYSLGAVFGESELESAEWSTDALVVKFDPQGRALWGRGFGGPERDDATCISVDDYGNVVVGGNFRGTVRFGESVFTAASGRQNAFLVQLDQRGEVLWATRAGSWGRGANATATGVTVDRSGSVVLGGYFNGHVDFGGASFFGAGLTDVFVARYGPGGGLIRADHAGGPSYEEVLGISADERGGVFIAGRFAGPLAFGPHLLEPDRTDAFVVRMGPLGFAEPGTTPDPGPGELPVDPQNQGREAGGVDHEQKEPVGPGL